MPSIWTQITNERPTYTDGYGVEREVSENPIITGMRTLYNKANVFFNGPETISLTNPETGEVIETPIEADSGLAISLLNPESAITGAKAVGTAAKTSSKIIDLDKIGAKAKITLGDPENYYYVAHQTSSANFPSIAKSGLHTGLGLNGTAAWLDQPYADQFASGMLKYMHNSHKGSDGLVIMKFPKSKFPGARSLDDISERLMDLGESKAFEIPTEYITMVKKTQLKQGGIIKAQNGLGKIPIIGKIAKHGAYKIVTEPSVGYAGGATLKSAVKGLLHNNEEDDNKRMFIYGVDRPETTDGMAMIGRMI